MDLLFKDHKDNEYYINSDKLLVKIVSMDAIRQIGILTYNLESNKANLVVHRKTEEFYKVGYFISSAVFTHIKVDKLTLIVDNTLIYLLDWEDMAEKIRPCSFIPSNGMEDQYLIPLTFFQQVIVT